MNTNTIGLLILYICLPVFALVIKISIESMINDILRLSHSKSWINKQKGKFLTNYFQLCFKQELPKTYFIYNFFSGIFLFFCLIIEIIAIVLFCCKRLDTSFLTSKGFLWFIGIIVTIMAVIHTIRQDLDKIFKK